MIPSSFDSYKQIVVCDTEFSQPPGHTPDPRCAVFYEMRSGREERLWRDQLKSRSKPPFSVGKDALWVTHYGSAEINVFRALGWPLPANLNDTYGEFSRLTAGVERPFGRGLLGIQAAVGLPCTATVEKDEGRGLAQQPRYSNTERKKLLDYCASDVRATADVFLKMAPHIDVPSARFRGEFFKVCSAIETAGVPLDVGQLDEFRAKLPCIKARMVADTPIARDVYETDKKGDVHLNHGLLEQWAEAHNVPWPRTDSGALSLAAKELTKLEDHFPLVARFAELQKTFSVFRRDSLPCGPDKRNRALLGPFGTKTARCSPRAKEFLPVGNPAWMRSFIKPERGQAVVYLDYKAEEVAIAGSLSGDYGLLRDYAAEDIYLAFGRRAGLNGIPRSVLKTVVLGAAYGMGPFTLSTRLRITLSQARRLLDAHHHAYPKFWAWSDSQVVTAQVRKQLQSKLGWQIRVPSTEKFSPNRYRNWTIQTAGSEIMMLASIYMNQAGIEIVATVHDGFFLMVPADAVDHQVNIALDAMTSASDQIVGYPIPADVVSHKYPGRYRDKDGYPRWRQVSKWLSEVKA